MNAKTKADPKVATTAQTPATTDNTEAWESGALGCDPAHAVAVPDDGSVDRALGLVVISTRVKKKQGKQMEKAAKKAGLCLKAWLRQALIEKLDSSKKGKKQGKQNGKKPKK
jgi:hypothetical protein